MIRPTLRRPGRALIVVGTVMLFLAAGRSRRGYRGGQRGEPFRRSGQTGRLRGLIHRIAVVAGAAAMLLGSAVGIASASGGLSWSPTTSPGRYNYGPVSLGQKVSQAFTLTNSGSAATSSLIVTLTKPTAFTITTDGCTDTTLAPNQSCSVTVTFAPTPGPNHATLTAKGGATASLTLLGNGTPFSWAPTTSPGTYSYGTVSAGQKVSQAFTLTHPRIRITYRLRLNLTGSTAFTVTSIGCGGITITQSCSVTVTFAPTASGQTYKATLTAANWDTGAMLASLTLTGAGTKGSPVISTTASAGGPVGTAVTDTAAFSDGSSPGGTIEFKLYGPSGTADCSGTPVFDRAVTVTGDGSYTSPSFSSSQAGTYWWTASYNGDANNNAAATSCGDESVVIGKASLTISTTASAGGPAGTVVIDTTILSGGFSPGGTIEFKLYGPSAAADCSGTPVDDETVTVTGNGNYTTLTGFTPSQAGTYWWTASYSGDASNNPAATSCGDESVAIGKASPAISTTASAGGPAGTAVTDTAALSGGSAPGGAIEFRLYGPSGTADCSGTAVFDQAVTVTGDGSYTSPSFSSSQAGTYWWTASYNGDANNNPAATNCGDEQVTIGASVHIYWSDYIDGTVLEANLDGTGVQTLDPSQASQYGVPGVAVDSSHIYWTSFGSGTVMEANLDGSGPQTLVTGQNGPYGVAVDSSHIYWTNEFGGTVLEANLDGTRVTTLVTGQESPQGVAVDGSHIYWADYGAPGTIMEANLDSSSPQTLVTGQNYPAFLAVGSGHIYWSDHVDATITEANLDGTGVQTLISGQGSPQGLAVDSGHIYWAEYGNGPGAGTVMEANLDGTGVTTLVTGQNFPYGVALGPQ
jgi:hypothetical protein